MQSRSIDYHAGMDEAATHAIGSATWLFLALVIVTAKLGGEIALRVKQPAVLGELVAGVLLGNLPLGALQAEARGPVLGFAAELGVMLLLFQVGLESSVGQMVRVAPRAGAVAVIGVVVPSVLGFGASALLVPQASTSVHLFIGATMCATSVGITATVLKDLGALGREEAKIILGAAVIDDVLGLVILAVVSAVAVSTTGRIDPWLIARITAAAVAFVVGALAIGLYVFRGAYRVASVLRAPHVLGALSVAGCLALAGTSALAGLAPIVGAYAAGLLLDEVSVRPFTDQQGSGVHKVDTFVSPIVAVFAPIFFVRTGMSVQLGGLDASSLLLTLVLVVTAFAGKLVSGLGVRGGGRTDRLLVGLGMTPRGEVGLIFADVGARLVVGGVPLFSVGVHAALVAAVFVTTLAAPPALAARIRALQGARKSETGGG
ncbi:MAG: Na(+)/H(+) antiporter [Labilithrix sp.]|nr:Na(+)/H(+) antiporter [Labilithrix sp.]